MKLTKGKISKLYNKKKQSLKKKVNKKRVQVETRHLEKNEIYI